ncbi:OmpA family protein [Formosimonas limnophila]|nr:OmpA family protein [Formosimonas limnophila]
MSELFDVREWMKVETVMKKLLTKTWWKAGVAAKLALVAALGFSAVGANAAVSSLAMSVISDGTAPFDATSGAGLDTSASNGIVRTMDKFTYTVSYVASDNTSVPMVFTLPVGAIWDATATSASVCNGTGGGTLSVDQRTLTCNRKPTPGAESFNLVAQVLSLANNTTFSTSFSASGNTVNSANLTVSATPKTEIQLLGLGPNRETINGVDSYSGLFLTYTGAPAVNNPFKGYESLQGPSFSYTIEVSPNTKLETCTPVTISSSLTAGTRTCTQAGGPGTPITVTVTGADTDYFGVTNAIDSSFYMNTRTNVKVSRPVTDFPSGVTTEITAKISGFDPVSVSGASNFGSGTAPGQDPTFTCPVGSTTKTCGRLTATAVAQPLNPQNAGLANVDMSAVYGDNTLFDNSPTELTEAILPGQKVLMMAGLFSGPSNLTTHTNTAQCMVWDNTDAKLSGNAFIGTSATSAGAYPALSALSPVAGAIIEYSNQSFSDDASRKAFDCGTAGDGASGWVTNPASLSGGMSSATVVRFLAPNGLAAANQYIYHVPVTMTTDTSVANQSTTRWFTQYKSDQMSLVKSTYSGTGISNQGGNMHLIKGLLRHTITVSDASVAPNETFNAVITPTTIGSPVAGVDGVVQDAKVTLNLPSNCVLPVESALPSNAVYTAGNFGPDGIPCTADDVSTGSVVVSFGDLAAVGGSVVNPYDGHPTTYPSVSIALKTTVNAPVANSTLSSVSSSPTDFTDLNGVGTEDRVETVNYSVSGVAAFSVTKTTVGVTNGKVGPAETFSYNIAFGNGGSTNTGKAFFVDLLPFDGYNGTTNLGTPGFVVTGLSGSMDSAAQGTVNIEYSTDPSATIKTAIETVGNEGAQTGVNWTSWVTGNPLPAGITAVRFSTSGDLNSGFSGKGVIQLRAPFVNSTTTITNDVFGNTLPFGGDPATVKNIRSASPVTITGLDAASLRGKVFIDTNANGTNDAGETGLAGTVVTITCTAGACLDGNQGSVFSMLVDPASGGYGFEPGAATNNKIFPNSTATGTALASFQGVIAGTWTITETPSGTPATTIFQANVGTVNGTSSGTAAGRSITGVVMPTNAIGVNYDFAERFLDGTIEVTKSLALPSGITGPLSFTFTATCDLPVANTQKSATLNNFPTNTTVSITGIAAGATCTVAETLPASPDSKYFWETPSFTALSPTTMPNGGIQSITATNKLSPTVTIAKTVTSAPTVVSGKPTQFDTTYRLTVSNTGNAAQNYDLKDTFGFDSDVTIVGSPTIVKSANVSGTVNGAFNGTTANSTIIAGESIAAGSTATPTTETYDVTVRINVPAGSGTANDVCSGTTSGQGLFNTGVLSVSGVVDQSANACSNTPAVAGVNLVLQKTWVSAVPGESVNIPATTGFSVNTPAFDAAATGSNSVSSSAVVVAGNEVGTLPTEVFAVPANAVNYGTGPWSCSDGTNSAFTVAQGANLTVPSASVGKTLTCTLTNTSLVDGVSVTKTVASGPTPVQGLSDQFDMVYRITVSNTNANPTVYGLSDAFGFESDVTVVGAPTVTKGSNVSGTVNPGFTGQGLNVSIIGSESIDAGSVSTPTTETYDVNVRIKVQLNGSSSNNTCNTQPANGLFNRAILSIGGTDKIADACQETPTVPSAQLKLQVKWIGATPGEVVNVAATTGLDTNTNAFSAQSTGTNDISSNDVTVLIGASAALPTPVFAVPSNQLNYVGSANWVCSDGLNPDVQVSFGGSFTLSNIYSGKNVVCTVTYSGVLLDTVKTSLPVAGTAVAPADTISYTLKTTVSGNPTQRDIVLTDTLGTGLTVAEVPSSCSISGQKISCTLASGAAVGEHSFTYKATVTDAASVSVSNSVVSSFGTCSSCSVTHPLWSVTTNKTSGATGKSGVRIDESINYTLTSVISGGASTRDIVLTDILGNGLTLSSVPAGCTSAGQILSCTIPSGSAAGSYSFNYVAKVNTQAQSTVVNTVSPSYGTCATCTVELKVVKDVGLLITKSAKTKTAKIGDFVRYEVIIENPSAYDADNFKLIDQPAPGLSYVSGSAQISGGQSFTVTAEYPLTVSGLKLASKSKMTLTYMMRVGASAGQGSLQNCAQARDDSSAVTSNRSCASITRTADPDFEDSRILGTVFEDSNGNGMQDDGEPGIPGVRLATVEGLLIETDAYGRYHIEGINPGQWARGSNFIVKVDVATVPEGAVSTTQNPLVKRLTQGLPGLFNFGFRVPFSTYEPGKPLSYPVMLSADGLFEYDRFDLLDAGRKKLADLAKHLLEDSKTQKGLKVSAYTDRLGSAAYNQKLSLKRAETIKAFLVSQGIDESLITIEGMGAAKPLVNCPGNKSAATIACLAPNRRFEVSLP